MNINILTKNKHYNLYYFKKMIKLKQKNKRREEEEEKKKEDEDMGIISTEPAKPKKNPGELRL